jgi:hypothetical protein
LDEWYSEMKQRCGEGGCSMQRDTCATAKAKVSALYACIDLRERIQKHCWAKDHPLYEGHMRQIAQARASLLNCLQVMQEKCK